MSKCGAICEVFSRVCGYFRPVTNWNKGKQEEFKVGEPFRAVRDEYSPVEYHEHIQCPGSPAVAVSKPPPEPPKITAFNHHCHCMA